MFFLSDCSVCLVAGVGGGGGVSCPDQFILPPIHLGIKVFFANSTYFKLSEREDVSNINIIQVKFSCFLCRIVPYA